MNSPDQHARTFPPAPAEAGPARTFVAEVLRQWGLPELEDAVTAAVNELFINAVAHARTRITIRLRLMLGRVTVEVEDLDERAPRRRVAAVDDEHFRGLQIVEALAQRWGSRPTSRGKVVWAEFPA